MLVKRNEQALLIILFNENTFSKQVYSSEIKQQQQKIIFETQGKHRVKFAVFTSVELSSGIILDLLTQIDSSRDKRLAWKKVPFSGETAAGNYPPNERARDKV